MKARVKATGETIDVEKYVDGIYVSTDDDGDVYATDDLDFWLNEPSSFDYWTRLEHTYAGMAMQGLMSYIEQVTPTEGCSFCDEIVDISFKVAHALVEKMKEERK